MFLRTYHECKKQFVSLSYGLKNYDTEHFQYSSGCIGPDGSELTTNLIKISKKSAKRWLLITSGIHGPELFCGSAIQAKILRMLSDKDYRLPENTGIILAHALNPWGSAYLRRTNINNVDLNRNYNDDFEELLNQDKTDPSRIRAIELYKRLDHVINITEVPKFRSIEKMKLSLYMLKHGAKNLKFAIQGGQRHKNRGYQFTGISKEKEIVDLQSFVDSLIPKESEAVVHVDVHTGLGSYGEDVMISSDQESNEVISGLFDKDRVDLNSVLGGQVSGFLISGLKANQKTDAKWISFVHEIGTLPALEVFSVLRNEAAWHNQNLWVEDYSRREQPESNIKDYMTNTTKDWMKEVFCPSFVRWQTSALDKGLEVFETSVKWLDNYKS